MMMQSPFIFLGLAFPTGLLALASPSVQNILLPVSFALSLSCIAACATTTLSNNAAELIVKGNILWCLHMGNLVYIQRWTVSSDQSTTIYQRIYQVYKMYLNYRWIGTSREAPYIRETDTKTSKQSRLGFVLGRLHHVIFLMMTEVIREIALQNLVKIQLTDVLDIKESFFRRLFLDVDSHSSGIDSRDLLIRMTVFLSGVRLSYVQLTILHDIFAAVFVGAGLDEPREWPPLFGDIREAYTIRRLWSRYCDRLFYRTVSSWAREILHRIKVWDGTRTTWGKLILILAVFALSAGIHLVAAKVVGRDCGLQQEAVWWLINTLAVVVEATVETIVCNLVRPPTWWTRDKQPPLWARLLGYLWVTAFSLWSVPKIVYPQLRCAF